jgi:hypothetical protein
MNHVSIVSGSYGKRRAARVLDHLYERHHSRPLLPPAAHCAAPQADAGLLARS